MTSLWLANIFFHENDTYGYGKLSDALLFVVIVLLFYHDFKIVNNIISLHEIITMFSSSQKS